jgi:hypothetical protein
MTRDQEVLADDLSSSDRVSSGRRVGYAGEQLAGRILSAIA